MAGSSQHTYLPGTEFVAKYDFPGSTPKDLSLKKGDIVEIVNKTKDPNWYIARRMADGKQGTIPINYMQQRRGLNLHAMPWFFGKITREKAEELLKPRDVGLFLVRESTNFPGDYTLCVVSPENEKVEHYRVISRNNKLTVDEEEFFENLVQLVKHYESDADGLCTRLVTPLKKEDKMSLSSKDFMESFKKDGWALDIKEVTFEEIIGSGEFGEVLKGKYQNRPVAIKKLKDDSTAAQTFLSEASVMTTLHHKNLVDLIGICFRDSEINIVTEFCDKGNLVDFLRSRGRKEITKQHQVGFANDICKGMSYLEDQGLVHRDLAARNILLAEDERAHRIIAKVSDFGLARDVKAELETGKFPVKWTAPESIKENKFSTKSDVWSFGILLWEVYSFGRNPYPRIPLNDVLNKVIQGYRMECPEGCPPQMFKLMRSCWEIKPNQRPSFKELSPLLDAAKNERETVL